MSATLNYLHDPMCSWCYAFNTSLLALEQTLPMSIEFVRIVGGLASDTMEPMPAPLQYKIQQVWRRIERTVPGVRFNFDFWQNNRPIRSTYPACRAVLAAKKQGASFETKMIAAIQNAYYQKALNPSLPETLVYCAEITGLKVRDFAGDFAGDEIEHELRNQIELTRRLGVVSFPSLRLKFCGKLYPVAIDYLDHAPMLETIKAILAGG